MYPRTQLHFKQRLAIDVRETYLLTSPHRLEGMDLENKYSIYSACPEFFGEHSPSYFGDAL